MRGFIEASSARAEGPNVAADFAGVGTLASSAFTILAAHEPGKKELEKPDSRSARTTHAEGFGGRGEGRPFACP
jgi:hypothetical protein